MELNPAKGPLEGTEGDGNGSVSVLGTNMVVICLCQTLRDTAGKVCHVCQVVMENAVATAHASLPQVWFCASWTSARAMSLFTARA